MGHEPAYPDRRTPRRRRAIRFMCVAELSANHNQDFDQAVKIIQAAKEAWRGRGQAADLHG